MPRAARRIIAEASFVEGISDEELHAMVETARADVADIQPADSPTETIEPDARGSRGRASSSIASRARGSFAARSIRGGASSSCRPAATGHS